MAVTPTRSCPLRPQLRLVRTGSDATTLDEQQIERLYRRHGHAIFRYLLSLTFGDKHLAEDILQETFLRAWRTPDLVGDRSETCRNWLVTVARNLVIDRLRHRRRRPAETGGAALPQVAAPHCDMERVVTSMTVQNALAKLTPARREILVHLYLHERSLNEIAETLGIPVGTVKSRAHYALRALRDHLDDARQPVTVAA
jgi:RNA polymerase sigma-70 factor (ECF subfamily)